MSGSHLSIHKETHSGKHCASNEVNIVSLGSELLYLELCKHYIVLCYAVIFDLVYYWTMSEVKLSQGYTAKRRPQEARRPTRGGS